MSLCRIRQSEQKKKTDLKQHTWFMNEEKNVYNRDRIQRMAIALRTDNSVAVISFVSHSLALLTNWFVSLFITHTHISLWQARSRSWRLAAQWLSRCERIHNFRIKVFAERTSSSSTITLWVSFCVSNKKKKQTTL